MERDKGELEHISMILPRVFSAEFLAEWRKRPEPPYDSPIEDIFAEHCFKHLRPAVQAEKQVEVATGHGGFRVDFVLSVGNRRIAVECDGKHFHEVFKDEFRDAIFLGEGHFETIYHFRGCDIVYWLDDCVWLMSMLDPFLFSQRGRLQLGRLRHLEISDNHEELAKCESFICQISDWDGTHTYPFWAFRRSVKMISTFPRLRYHWKVLYDFACKYPRASLDELLNIRTSSYKRKFV